MQFEVYRNNGGRYHWRLVGEDGSVLAVSVADFATEDAASEYVEAIRPPAGMKEPAR